MPPPLSVLKLSIVFSFRNEEDALRIIFPRLRKVCSGMGLKDYEFIFVNDCSTDKSLDILLQEQQAGQDLIIVNTSRRFGVSECVLAGLKEASGDYVVYMDIDLQDPPELVPEMLTLALKEEADVVYTTRLSRKGESWFKLKLTALGYWILNTFSAIDVPPNSGDFKLLSRRVVSELLRLKEHKPFMRGLVTWVGFKQVQFFYDRDPRAAGETHFPIFSRRVIYNFLDSALISFSDAPLKAALAMGVLVTLGASLLFIWIIVQKAMGWALPGWSAIMATMLVLGGIQLMVTGVMGLYLHTIYIQVKGRPLYIVDRVYKPSESLSVRQVEAIGSSQPQAANSALENKSSDQAAVHN